MSTTTKHDRAGGWLYRWLLAFGTGCLLLAGLAAAAPAHAQSSTVLSGYVFSFDGKPLEGATITVFRMPEHVAIASTKAAADGTWSLDTGPGNNFAVRAEAEGYDPSEYTVYPSNYQTGIAFLLPPAGQAVTVPLVASISGRVTDLDGVALGGMTIYTTNAQETGVKELPSPPTLSTAATDADGRYTMQIPAGEVWVGIKTGAAWGYQQLPRQVQSGDSYTDGDFVVAIRTGGQYFPPTSTPAAAPTAAPTAVPTPEPGMPTTGQADVPAWPALAALGLLALLAGWALRSRTAVRS